MARHSCDAIWGENEPIFHASDYDVNIEIEVSKGLRTLGRETRLRSHEYLDDEADADSEHDEGSTCCCATDRQAVEPVLTQ